MAIKIDQFSQIKTKENQVLRVPKVGRSALGGFPDDRRVFFRVADGDESLQGGYSESDDFQCRSVSEAGRLIDWWSD